MTSPSRDEPAQPHSGAPPPPGHQRARYQRVLAGCAAAGFCAVLAAGCGSAAAPSPSTSGAGTGSAGTGSTSPASTGTGSTSPAAAGPASAAKISLDVSFSGSPSTAPAHYILRCEPAGGTVRDPATACTRLMRGTSLFGPMPAHIACPMIMADAGRATVTGTYLGQKVHESVVDGGCDLSRWAKLKQVFG